MSVVGRAPATSAAAKTVCSSLAWSGTVQSRWIAMLDLTADNAALLRLFARMMQYTLGCVPREEVLSRNNILPHTILLVAFVDWSTIA
jgi:hypothetical protein